ncbi:uncharacterized protein N7496_010237 [Penicillium cataractarum]|uniref:NACHT domain-containing protein n=1 Tax=Penicillium cataractarum TaxID=2100454 RepID=A0A9W9V1R7_9EURO|nr:uncharacterized protein N7496_010237 [Penicillium cataractarum]KAJ5364524.1 hypothetical protein N7496_010237 [Penicillium cataractarum]
MKFCGRLKKFMHGSHQDRRGDSKSKNQQILHPNTEFSVEAIPAFVDVPPVALTGHWKDALEQVNSEHPKLVESYRKILLQQTPVGGELPSDSDYDLLLGDLIKTRFQEIEKAQLKFTIYGREIIVREQVRRTVNIILTAKDFISTAVSSEPHAALAWAGVLVLLNPVVKSTTQGDDAMEFFEKISMLMVRYRVVESTPIDLPASASPDHANSLKDLTSLINTQMIKLYAQILKYQIHLAKHFIKSGFFRFVEDLAVTDDWNGMYRAINDVDESICQSLNTLNMHTMTRIECDLGSLHGKIDASKEIMIDARDNAKEAREAQLLSQLDIAKEARMDSWDVGQKTPGCLEGTQVKTLQAIQNWLECPQSGNIYWLSGMAGTGKSTISRTVAMACGRKRTMVNQEPLPRNILLGACFFFDKNDNDRKTAKRLFTTICSDLTTNLPDIKSDVCDCISAHPHIGSESISNQWRRLILDPLVLLDKNSLVQLTLVIVIDALDECEDDEDIDSIIQLFNQVDMLSTISLRLLLTSRPEIRIQSSFNSISNDPRSAFQKNELQKVNVVNIDDDDITKFVSFELDRIAQKHNMGKDWPGKEQIKKLAEKSDGLFIYAATACRFLSSSRLAKNERERRLQMIFEGKCDESTPQHSLDLIYTQILQISVIGEALDEEKEERCRLFQKVVGALITLFTPLCIEDISKLLAENKSDIESIFQRLHSAISGGEDRASPVRLLHLSFRDFLLDDQRCLAQSFLISQRDVHDLLLTDCLHVLSATLKQNICSFSDESTLAADIEPAQLESHLPHHVQYACLHWVGHLQGAMRESLDGDEVFKFLTAHLLHWLEALCLMGKFSEGLYVSSLAYCPENSYVRKYFSHVIPKSIIRPPKVRKGWDSCQQTLYVAARHKNLCFSPDGKLVAICTVHIWETATGSLVKTFDTLEKGCLVEFSSDGKQIICLLKDATVKVWNVATGILVKEIQGHPDSSFVPILGLFSSDKSLAVFADSRGTIQILGLENEETKIPIKAYTEQDSSEKMVLALSPDGTTLATGYEDGKLEFWCTLTGNVRHGVDFTFSAHGPFSDRGKYANGRFSLDGTKFGLTCGVGILHVWDTAKGVLLKQINDDCLDLIFLPDGRLLTADSREVRIWDLEPGAIVERFPVSFGSEISLRLSANGNLSSVEAPCMWGAWCSGGHSGINVLNLVTGLSTALNGHTSRVNDLVFSHDGMMASAASDGTVRLWDLTLPSTLEQADKEKYSIRDVITSPCNDAALIDLFGQALLWDAKTGTIKKAIDGYGLWSFSPDGRLFFRKIDNNHQVWSRDTCELLRELPIQSPGMRWQDVAFSPDGQLLATRLGIWEISTGEHLHTFSAVTEVLHGDKLFPSFGDYGKRVEFSPDGRLLAIRLNGESNADHKTAVLEIWNVTPWKRLAVRVISVDSMARPDYMGFTPDRKSLAIGGYCMGLQLWNFTSDRVTIPCTPGWSVEAIAFSPDSKRLAFWRSDWKFGLYDLATGTLTTKKTDFCNHWPGIGRVQLYFSEDSAMLDTSFGRIDVDAFFHGTNSTNSAAMFVDNNWVMQGSKRVFCFPRRIQWRMQQPSWTH